MEFHVLGVLYLLSLCTYYAWRYLAALADERRLVLCHESLFFASGVILAGTIYAWIHILPNPKEYFYIATHCLECDEGVLLTEFKRLIRIFVLRPTDVLIFFFVCASALTRRRWEDKHYLVVVVGWLVAQAIVGPPPYAHYIGHLWPLVALGVGGLVTWGFSYKPSRWRIPVSVIVAPVLLVANLGMHLSGSHPYLISYQLGSCRPPAEEPRSGDQEPECQTVFGQATSRSAAIDYIHRVVPRETVIMAGVPLFYPLRDYENFLAYRDGSLYGADLRGENMLEFWRRIEPEVVLLDEDFVTRDDELNGYLRERQFVHVMTGLWVSEHVPKAQPIGMSSQGSP
jgi:hypothetical protein